MGFLSRILGSRDRSGSRKGSSHPPASSTARAASPPRATKAPTPPSLPQGVEPPTGRESLVLYKFDSCPFCQRVQRQLEPLGLAQDIELRDTRQDPKARALLQEETGRTQVPCLFINGKPLFESSDISAYLQAYSQAKESQGNA